MEKPTDPGKDLSKYFGLMLEKLKADSEFKLRLQENFRQAALEVGWELPEDHPYRAFFDSATHKHFVLPSAPKICGPQNCIRY